MRPVPVASKEEIPPLVTFLQSSAAHPREFYMLLLQNKIITWIIIPSKTEPFVDGRL